jgi:hypothetical protein
LAASYAAVLTQKGTTLKVIVVNLLNLSNRNSYRHSLVFFVSDLVVTLDFCSKGTSFNSHPGHQTYHVQKTFSSTYMSIAMKERAAFCYFYISLILNG